MFIEKKKMRNFKSPESLYPKEKNTINKYVDEHLFRLRYMDLNRSDLKQMEAWWLIPLTGMEKCFRKQNGACKKDAGSQSSKSVTCSLPIPAPIQGHPGLSTDTPTWRISRLLSLAVSPQPCGLNVCRHAHSWEKSPGFLPFQLYNSNRQILCMISYVILSIPPS